MLLRRRPNRSHSHRPPPRSPHRRPPSIATQPTPARVPRHDLGCGEWVSPPQSEDATPPCTAVHTRGGPGPCPAAVHCQRKRALMANQPRDSLSGSLSGGGEVPCPGWPAQCPCLAQDLREASPKAALIAGPTWGSAVGSCASADRAALDDMVARGAAMEELRGGNGRGGVG